MFLISVSIRNHVLFCSVNNKNMGQCLPFRVQKYIQLKAAATTKDKMSRLREESIKKMTKADAEVTEIERNIQTVMATPMSKFQRESEIRRLLNVRRHLISLRSLAQRSREYADVTELTVLKAEQMLDVAQYAKESQRHIGKLSLDNDVVKAIERGSDALMNIRDDSVEAKDAMAEVTTSGGETDTESVTDDYEKRIGDLLRSGGETVEHKAKHTTTTPESGMAASVSAMPLPSAMKHSSVALTGIAPNASVTV